MPISFSTVSAARWIDFQFICRDDIERGKRQARLDGRLIGRPRSRLLAPAPASAADVLRLAFGRHDFPWESKGDSG